jgi:catechol 2,3-dioxygenase-like lactoylglutathione lyase family enzyme
MAVGPVWQVHISVTDLDRAIAFYRDVLEIPLLLRVPGQPMAFFASGDVRLYLGIPESPEFTSKQVIYFRVDDIDAEHARLAKAGVEFVGVPHIVSRSGNTETWMAFFRDPDGHYLTLVEPRSTG